MSTRIKIAILTDDADIQNDARRIYEQDGNACLERYLIGMLLGYRFVFDGPLRFDLAAPNRQTVAFELESIGPKGMVDYFKDVPPVQSSGESISLDQVFRDPKCTCTRLPYAPVCPICSERLTSEIQSARKIERAKLAWDKSVNGVAGQVSGAPDKKENQ